MKQSGKITPNELQLWCQANIKSRGRLCRTLYTADEFVIKKEGCDWEIANFILHELTLMQYDACVLYIACNDHLHCQASVIYRDHLNQWWWFIWSNESIDKTLLCGSFQSINQLLAVAKGEFEKLFRKIDYSKIGNTRIEPNWTFVEYLEMVEGWERAPRRSRK